MTHTHRVRLEVGPFDPATHKGSGVLVELSFPCALPEGACPQDVAERLLREHVEKGLGDSLINSPDSERWAREAEALLNRKKAVTL